MFTKTKLYISGFLVLALGSLLLATISIPDASQPKASEGQSWQYQPTAVAAANGCGGVFIFDINKEWYGTIPESIVQGHPDDGIPSQEVNIPTYGFMSREAFAPEKVGVYDKTFTGFPRQDINRALWDGYNIIWYNKKVTAEQFDKMSKYVASLNTSKPTTFLLPYTIAERNIPYNRDIAFSSWGASESCLTFDTNAYNQFVDAAKTRAPKHEGVPPVAPLDSVGRLYQIKAFSK